MKLLLSKIVFTSLSLSSLSSLLPSVSADDNGENWNYDGTCIDQSQCLVLQVVEEARKCGSASCEYEVCWETVVGIDYGLLEWEGQDEAIWSGCKEERNTGVDYIGDMAKAGALDTAEGGCPNVRNSHGKGYWDDECHNPNTFTGAGLGAEGATANFEKVCQVVSPGHTIHFLMHSWKRMDKKFGSATEFQMRELSCAGTATVGDTGGKSLGSATCLPSTSDPSSPNGQTYFPTSDPAEGGTCVPPADTGGIKNEGTECVWSYTAPNACQFEESGDPTCHLDDNADTICPNDGPVAELYVNPNNPNPNDPPPRVPLHGFQFDGGAGEVVTFSVHNPYADPNVSHSESVADAHDMYVVYDQANELGNEVCNLESGYGNCATNTAYTAKCRSDGYAIITVFASGKDAESAAAKQITNGGTGTDTYMCCPKLPQPQEAYGKQFTSAWTYLVHCSCPSSQPGRRNLRSSVSEQFQSGALFTGETKVLHNL